ncbi:MAG: hypothetical protein ABT940_12285 [Alphaproteobacteria bacterium]
MPNLITDRRLQQGIASAVILLAIAFTALQILPPSARTTVAEYRLSGGGISDVEATLPVFRLEEDGFPVKCGQAALTGDGRLRFTPYGGNRSILSDPSIQALLFDADPVALWTLLPDHQRTEIRRMLSDFVISLRRTWQKAVREPAFDSEYRPMVRDIADRALERAMNQPRTRTAWQEAVANIDPTTLDDMMASLRPILVDKAGTALWTTVTDYTSKLFADRRTEVEWGPLTRVLSQTLQDARGREALARAGSRLLDNPKMDAFLSILAVEFGAAMIDDDRLVPLLSRILSDFETLTASDPNLSRGALHTLLHGLPGKLMGLRTSKDHNALASFVVTSMAKARRAHFLVLASPDDFRRLAASTSLGTGFPVGRVLVRETRP